jgi:hypothetical protein
MPRTRGAKLSLQAPEKPPIRNVSRPMERVKRQNAVCAATGNPVTIINLKRMAAIQRQSAPFMPRFEVFHPGFGFHNSILMRHPHVSRGLFLFRLKSLAARSASRRVDHKRFAPIFIWLIRKLKRSAAFTAGYAQGFHRFSNQWFPHFRHS